MKFRFRKHLHTNNTFESRTILSVRHFQDGGKICSRFQDKVAPFTKFNLELNAVAITGEEDESTLKELHENGG